MDDDNRPNLNVWQARRACTISIARCCGRHQLTTRSRHHTPTTGSYVARRSTSPASRKIHRAGIVGGSPGSNSRHGKAPAGLPHHEGQRPGSCRDERIRRTESRHRVERRRGNRGCIVKSGRRLSHTSYSGSIPRDRPLFHPALMEKYSVVRQSATPGVDFEQVARRRTQDTDWCTDDDRFNRRQ